jgi:hypothetical protein
MNNRHAAVGSVEKRGLVTYALERRWFMHKKSAITSLEMDLEMRRRIDDLRLARARASEGVPPSMRAIIIEAVSQLLEQEQRFTPVKEDPAAACKTAEGSEV